jgi:hypothetical protein
VPDPVLGHYGLLSDGFDHAPRSEGTTPIRAFDKSWAAACAAAGCPGRIPHSRMPEFHRRQMQGTNTCLWDGASPNRPAGREVVRIGVDLLAGPGECKGCGACQRAWLPGGLARALPYSIATGLTDTGSDKVAV